MGTTGLFEFEREKPQPFIVNLTLCFIKMKAGLTDQLSDTVDYGRVFSLVRETVEGKRFDLIEALAEAISSEVMSAFPSIDAMEVIVQKPEAPVEGTFDFMGVRIFRERTIKISGRKQ